jgi:hypothetical protein
LEKVKGQKYSLQVNRYAIATMQQISPPQDAAWMSTLRLEFAYQAWSQLTKAYGSHAELDMQRKLFEFESASQRENESVRDWTIRLDRQVTELNVLSKEAAKDNVMGYNALRDTAVYESTHKFRLLNVRIDNQSHEAFVATLRCQIFGMSIKEVETALITYEQGRDVQRAMNSAAGGASTSLFNVATESGDRRFTCYACNGEGHSWKSCPATSTPEGAARLMAKSIRLPRHLRPQARTTMGPARHDYNHGRGYGGRGYVAGRGGNGHGRGRFGTGRFGRGRALNDRHVRFERERTNVPGTDLA